MSEQYFKVRKLFGPQAKFEIDLNIYQSSAKLSTYKFF